MNLMAMMNLKTWMPQMNPVTKMNLMSRTLLQPSISMKSKMMTWKTMK